MPSSTAPVSESGPPVGAAVDGQIVHGQPGGGWVADAVVNVQLVGVIRLPAVSRAPDTVAVYVVAAASAADGVKVTVWLAASYAVLPDTEVLPAARVTTGVAACTGSLKVAVTVVVVATPVAPAAGLRDVTVGGVVSPPPPPDPVLNTTSTQ